MELFGTLTDPTEPPAEGNRPAPFHVYSMRHAIEEKFILDVLQNYTTRKLAFRLAHNGKDYDDKEVERRRGVVASPSGRVLQALEAQSRGDRWF